MISPPPFLVFLAQPWAACYKDLHLPQPLRAVARVGAPGVGGGTAIAADRGTLRLTSDVDRRRHLLEVAQIHRLVISSLVVVVLSGLLLFASDVEAHWTSPISWVKMALIVGLLANGGRMQRI